MFAFIPRAMVGVVHLLVIFTTLRTSISWNMISPVSYLLPAQCSVRLSHYVRTGTTPSFTRERQVPGPQSLGEKEGKRLGRLVEANMNPEEKPPALTGLQ